MQHPPAAVAIACQAGVVNPQGQVEHKGPAGRHGGRGENEGGQAGGGHVTGKWGQHEESRQQALSVGACQLSSAPPQQSGTHVTAKSKSSTRRRLNSPGECTE